MKKAHHIDITNPGCNSDDIKKELQDFYSSLSKNQEKHSVIKIKNKAKVSKMIESIQVMIENNSSNINPYLEELSNILTFLVSPNIDDVDIDSLNYSKENDESSEIKTENMNSDANISTDDVSLLNKVWS